MRSLFAFLLGVSIFLPHSLSFARDLDHLRDLEAQTELISAEGVRALQVAMPEFERAGLDLSEYRVEIVRFDSTLAVLFIDAAVSPEEARQVHGSPGKIPAFGVEMSRDDFQVIRAHFQR